MTSFAIPASQQALSRATMTKRFAIHINGLTAKQSAADDIPDAAVFCAAPEYVDRDYTLQCKFGFQKDCC